MPNNRNANFGRETNVNEVKRQNQQAEMKKQQASGIFASNGFAQAPNAMNAEFGQETDIQSVKQQNLQAEMKKQQASGMFAKKQNPNNNN